MQDDGTRMLLKLPLFLFLSDPELLERRLCVVIQHIIRRIKLNNILPQLFIVFTSSCRRCVELVGFEMSWKSPCWPATPGDISLHSQYYGNWLEHKLLLHFSYLGHYLVCSYIYHTRLNLNKLRKVNFCIRVNKKTLVQKCRQFVVFQATSSCRKLDSQ